MVLSLTEKGRRRVEADAVLDVLRLQASLDALPESVRAGLLRGIDKLAGVAEDKASRDDISVGGH